MATGPDHYREAEQLLAFAQSVLDDDSNDPGPREDYESDEDFFAAVQIAVDADRTNERTAAVYARLAQAHAALAHAAACALNDRNGSSVRDYYEWVATAGIDAAHVTISVGPRED